MRNIYKFADVVVEIRNRGQYFYDCCADYLAEDEEPQISVLATDDDLVYEQQHAEENIEFSKSYLEFIALYRKFCEEALQFGVVLCHGSVVELNGEAFMFSAPSGTGKSTHARMWREYFGDDVIMINDDKPLLKFEKDGVYAYGTPWDGKHHLSNNRRAKLSGICFLHRAEENHIERMTVDQSISLLMNQIYRPRDTDRLIKTMEYADRLIRDIPMYSMGCTISHEAAEMAYNMMKEK